MHKTSLVFLLILLIGCPIYSQKLNLNNGLIAHYLFNKEVEDHSGNKNNGTQIGGVTFDTDRFGSQCGAIHFNGSNSYVTIPNSRSLASPTKELTVATWFRLDKTKDDLKWLTVCCKSDLKIETLDSPQYRCQSTKVTVSINTDFTEKTQEDIKINQWHHYALVYNGKEVKAYLNGREYFDFPYSKPFVPNNMPLEIGRDMPGALEYFAGSLDDLRIYNRGLSKQEIQAVYNDDSERNSVKPCNPPKPPQPPIITMQSPSSNPFSTANNTQVIEASVEYVSSKNDIDFNLNGKSVKNFRFDKGTKILTAQVNLIKGNNVFDITATNADGQDFENGNIVFEVTTQPPVITMINPSRKNHMATQVYQEIQAKIEHLSNKQDITFNVNGQSISDFTFSKTSQIFKSTIDLTDGGNLYEITATNSDGEDKKTGIILFEPPVPVPSFAPPIITILTPNVSPHKSKKPKQSIQAKIEYIMSRDDIQLNLNGKPINDFDYNISSKLLNVDVTLSEGFNVFEITATNTDGRDEAYGQIRYTSPQIIPPPPAPKPDLELGTVTINTEIVVPSPKIELICYDNKKEDGDIVSVILNETLILLDKVELKNKGNGEVRVFLPDLLPNQPYTIVSKAWNLGKSPPNTMTMELYDGATKVQTVVLNSKIGESDAIRIIYKK